MKTKAFLLMSLVLTSCGYSQRTPVDVDQAPPIDKVGNDGYIPKGRAFFDVGMSNELSLMNLLINKAYAATVTYTNSPSATFTVNTASLAASGFSGDYLGLGSVTVTALDDNNLRICGTGSQKCTSAIVRIYTTGTYSGFVNSSGYGVPVYSDKTASPTTSVGLGSANSAIVQTYTIPGNRNRVRLNDFPSPTYNMRSDFSDAGAGSYSMTVVIEYAVGL